MSAPAGATGSDRTGRVDGPTRVARACIVRTLGVEVQLWDAEGRQGAHDLRFEWAGHTVAVETKLVVDNTQREAESVAGELGYTLEPRLASSWTIDHEHRARFRRAHRALPDLLRRAEQIGWAGGDIRSLRSIDRPLHDEMGDLGISIASRHAATEKHPPGFYVMPSGWGGAVPSIEVLPRFAGDLLSGPKMSKLRRQLREAEADERHAFLFIGWEYMEAVSLSDSGTDLPNSEPSLPDSVDGVWLAATTSTSRVIAWLPSQGWVNASSVRFDD